jgi:Tfp pilus assembly protein PilF
MHRSIIGAMTCAVLVLAVPALGASQKDRDDCRQRGPSANLDLQIEACTRIIDDRGEPQRARTDAYNERAIAWSHKKDIDRAIADYDEAIRLEPTHFRYYERGELWGKKRNFDRAIADYGEAIRLNPDYRIAYSSRAGAYMSKQDYDRAIADYNRVISFNPDSPASAPSHKWRGDAWFAKGDLDRAIADYGEAIRLYPNGFGGMFQVTRCWARALGNRDLTPALADCNEALRLSPNNNVGALSARGFVYLRLGRLDDAIADYDTGIKIYPKHPHVLYGRGLAKLRKGDRAGGDADIAAAKAIWADVASFFAKYGLVPTSAVTK